MFNLIALSTVLLSANLADIPTQLSLPSPEVVEIAQVKPNSQTGQASYYDDYYNGRQMANGQLFSNSSDSCAHRTLRFGTVVTIRNTANGRTTTCVVRDRGPFVSGRVIDLSEASFSQIAPLSQGIVNVEISW